MNAARHWLPALLVLLSLSNAAFAQAPVSGPESKQFDFLLGQWDLDVQPKVGGLAAMIHGAPRLGGQWKAWRTLDGLAIEDELRIVDNSGNLISLTRGLRIYSRTEGRWKVSLLDAYRARFSESSGLWQGREMRLQGAASDPEGKPVLTRMHYFDITANGFRMQQDRSMDDGKTWDEAVLTIVARRVAGTT